MNMDRVRIGVKWFGGILFLLGLVLFFITQRGMSSPPENLPNWLRQGITLAYDYTIKDTDPKLTGHPAVTSGIYVGRGTKAAPGGSSQLQFNQPAFRGETAEADSRVDSRSKLRSFLAMWGDRALFLMILGLALWVLPMVYALRDRLDRLTVGNSIGTPGSDTDASHDDVPSFLRSASNQEGESPQAVQAGGIWQRVQRFFRGGDVHVHNHWPDRVTLVEEPTTTTPSVAQVAPAVPAQPLELIIIVETELAPKLGEALQLDSRHAIRATIPNMREVHAVEAHLKIGQKDTVQDMNLKVN
jgi:hypothetical protein